MRDAEFEWDDAKAAANAAKHGVTFQEARYVFVDQHAIEFQDNRADYGEERRQRPCRNGRQPSSCRGRSIY
jgi:uncharacterized protein